MIFLPSLFVMRSNSRGESNSIPINGVRTVQTTRKNPGHRFLDNKLEI